MCKVQIYKEQRVHSVFLFPLLPFCSCTSAIHIHRTLLYTCASSLTKDLQGQKQRFCAFTEGECKSRAKTDGWAYLNEVLHKNLLNGPISSDLSRRRECEETVKVIRNYKYMAKGTLVIIARKCITT